MSYIKRVEEIRAENRALIVEAAREFAALDAMIREDHPRPGDTRTCPGCGHPQHYTGAEHGWAHDAGWWTYEEA